MSPSEAISPTAHYTGYVWARNGLSHPELATLEGRLLFESVRPVFILSGALGGASLEAYLLARHAAIDALLERAIDDGRISQVIEVACGLSPRGWRFSQRHGERLTYVEADLPEMADRKRRALARMGALNDRHRVAAVDALQDDGPLSLASIAGELDHEQGLAIVTEGLLGYLGGEAVDGMWKRFVAVLSAFADGSYISDFHVREIRSPQVRAFGYALSAFVRGRVHIHFEDAAEAQAALMRADFTTAETHRASDLAPEVTGRGRGFVHILEASIR